MPFLEQYEWHISIFDSHSDLVEDEFASFQHRAQSQYIDSLCQEQHPKTLRYLGDVFHFKENKATKTFGYFSVNYKYHQ
jgi:hypothetical protein